MAFSAVFHLDKCQPEAAGDDISGAFEFVWPAVLDKCVKFGDSRSKGFEIFEERFFCRKNERT